LRLAVNGMVSNSFIVDCWFKKYGYLKREKNEIYEKINKVIKDTSSVVFVNFHGLGVGDTTDLRRN